MTTAIEVSNLSKRYIIGSENASTLREMLMGIGKTDQSKHTFYALNDLSFEIKQGETVGIIGKNGAGKSTLLKVLSKITKPTSGTIKLYGRVSSLLEVGTGFHPELTGKENIFLNGSILGMKRREIASKFDEIVEFSGIDKFLHTPVKHYSSGMYVRLAFAVAAHLEPEILIVDEVLAVGDIEFQKKCLGKMSKVASEGRTVLFVSHNMSAMRTLCSRGLVLSAGQLEFDGTIHEAIDHYRMRALPGSGLASNLDAERNVGNGKFRFSRLWIEDENGQPKLTARSGEKITICTSVKANTAIEASVECRIYDRANNRIASLISGFFSQKVAVKEGTVIRWTIEKLPITGGEYFLELAAYEDFAGMEMVDEVSNAMRLKIEDADYYGYGVPQAPGRNKVYLDFSIETRDS